MNSLQISCPAKTFVIGEYAVLDGGSAVLVNTSPRFLCTVTRAPQACHFPINSPVQQWVSAHAKDFKDISLEWSDPYLGGGLGFSSAQFTAAYIYSFALQGKQIENLDPTKVWKAYRGLAHEGIQPSGADIISQWIGGVCVFEQNPISFQSVTLPFLDLEFKIFRTGNSLKTHQHLKELKLSSVENLKEIAKGGVAAVEERDESLFLKAINEYRKILKDKGLVQAETVKILEELDEIPEIAASKGCGAMGADTIILFYKKEYRDVIKEKTSHFSFVAGSEELTYGIEFHEKPLVGDTQS